MIKILFVCHGNICRSPMAEFILKDMVNKAGVADRFLIASAASQPAKPILHCLCRHQHGGDRQSGSPWDTPASCQRGYQYRGEIRPADDKERL